MTTEALRKAAYAAFDAGQLHEASTLFARLLEAEPDVSAHHYMRGLAHKYLRDWPTSLAHNLRSLELDDEEPMAQRWNAGIAATALGDWAQARVQWRACGIQVSDGDGPTEGDFGAASIRLNAWANGETLYARRIDVVRARLINIPLPDSGYRYGDIVLHDGASTGSRPWGDGHVPVFNALQRLVPSDFKTFTAFVRCATEADADALERCTGPGIGDVEDWTAMSHYCLRCSYGVVHRHASTKGAWQQERTFGIAAQSRSAAERVLAQWAADSEERRRVVGRGRSKRTASREVEALEHRESSVPEPEDGIVWWRGPEETPESDD